MAKEAVWGGMPPHKNNLIGTAAVGVSKLVPLKTNNTALDLSRSPRSSTCSLANDPEASVALDPRLNIGLRKRAKRRLRNSRNTSKPAALSISTLGNH